MKVLAERGLTHAVPSKGNFVGPRSKNRPGLVGVLFPDDEIFFFGILAALEDRMSHFGLAPVLRITHGSPDRERRALNFFRELEVDGVVAVPNALCIEAYRECDVPVVFFDNAIKGLPVPTVMTDDREGARDGVSHLVNLGHRDIAYIGSQGDETARQRLAGFRDALEVAEFLVPDSHIKCREYSRQWGYYAARELFADEPFPTAIFCGNDTIASGVLRHLRNRGIACPAQVSVLGFSNSELSIDLELSSVDQPRADIAKAVWSNLQSRMKSEEPPLETKLMTSLVVRKSTAAKT